jgi:hypothetical protein
MTWGKKWCQLILCGAKESCQGISSNRLAGADAECLDPAANCPKPRASGKKEPTLFPARNSNRILSEKRFSRSRGFAPPATTVLRLINHDLPAACLLRVFELSCFPDLSG